MDDVADDSRVLVEHIRQTTAKAAAALWSENGPAERTHPYLLAKGIQPHGIRQAGDRLLLPVRIRGELRSLQLIGPDLVPRLMAGGETARGYLVIGTPGAVVCLAVDFATTASVHEATGHAVAITFAADNLEAVARALRVRMPATTLAICADAGPDGSAQPTEAAVAAEAVGGVVAVPDFGADRPEGATNFNDLFRLRGAAVVAAAIARVVAPRAPVAREAGVAALPPRAEAATDAQTIARLAALSTLDYDRCREAEAERLGVRVSALDKAVAGARRSDTEPTVDFPEIVPWPDRVDPATLLRELSETISRFIVCRTETAHAAALWAAMTWFMDVVQVAPLAVITAPEKRCGKTQLLAVLNKLVYRPLPASSISPAGLFRTIDAWRPTLLIDEADAFVRDNEELRGLLNCGHTRDSAFVVRLVGDDFTPRKFTVWGAKALAGIGHLADTVMDRAVTLELRRKLPHEPVTRLRHAAPDLFDNLVAKLARFAVDYREAIRQARPPLPDALNDRAQDNWEPLLAIADVAGGPWPAWGRAAALALSGDDAPSMSTGTELLADIREVFELLACTRIKTADLIAALCEDEEMPWATYNRGKPISPRQVAIRLKGYCIHSKTIRLGAQTPKGYERAQFDEAFARYLSPQSAPESSRHAPQPNVGVACGVADRNHVAATLDASATPGPAWTGACGGVADFRGDNGWNRVEVEI